MVKCPILGFSSGPDIEPCIGHHAQHGVCLKFSLPPDSPLALALSKMDKYILKIKKRPYSVLIPQTGHLPAPASRM